jgi:protein dithiol oxidoreductase (disulfide-forming)
VAAAACASQGLRSRIHQLKEGPHVRKPMLKSTLLALLLALGAVSMAQAADTWVEGKNYFLVDPPQRTQVAPGKVEVLEVFSYGCPACNAFEPYIKELRRQLPANAQMNYLPASFQQAEDWPMFQRAFLTAQLLGLVDKTQDAIYEEVWKSTDAPLSTLAAPNRLKSPQPSIEDAAKVYNRLTGVAVDKFLATARSFTVDLKMKQADAKVIACQVDQTPTLIVNGKYRITQGSAGGSNQVIALVKYLVAKESKS